MAYYTVPAENDTIGIFEFFNYVNNTGEGFFFPAIIFIVWIISFLGLKQYSASRAWTFASFFCGVLSILLAVLNLISAKIMYIFIVFFAIGLVWLKLDTE